MNKKRMIFTLIAAMALGTVMIGCTNKTSASDTPQSVSLVRRVTRNCPTISLNTESVYDKIYEAAYSYGDVSVVSAEGTPKVVCNYNLKEPDKKIDNAKRNQLATNNTAQMIAEMSAITSTTPEADTLTSIRLSADTLHSTSGEKTMFIFDSGLSTAGLLNFAKQNIIGTDPAILVEQLEARHAIPDLSDIHVVWVGLGQVCGEQPELTADYQYRLEEIWRAVLTKGNAASITFDRSPVSGEAYAGSLPQCSIVPVVADVLDVETLVTEAEMPEVIKWDEASPVNFQGDKADFVDYQAAAKELEPVADYLTANPEQKVYIFGMTATITGGGPGTELAVKRAQTVKEVLTANGVSEEQITCVGLGQISNPLRVEDVDTNGCQIPELAQKNRAVFVIREDSAMVEVLLDCVNSYV